MENQLNQAAESVERMLDRFNVGAVFGGLTREGDVAVIPVAEVSAFFGFGYGSGEGPAPAQEASQEGGVASGGGGGGGGRGAAKPRGIVKITPDGVSFEPAVNPTLISLAGIALVAWVISWVALTVRAFARK